MLLALGLRIHLSALPAAPCWVLPKGGARGRLHARLEGRWDLLFLFVSWLLYWTSGSCQCHSARFFTLEGESTLRFFQPLQDQPYCHVSSETPAPAGSAPSCKVWVSVSVSLCSVLIFPFSFPSPRSGSYLVQWLPPLILYSRYVAVSQFWFNFFPSQLFIVLVLFWRQGSQICVSIFREIKKLHRESLIESRIPFVHLCLFPAELGTIQGTNGHLLHGPEADPVLVDSVAIVLVRC